MFVVIIILYLNFKVFFYMCVKGIEEIKIRLKYVK